MEHTINWNVKFGETTIENGIRIKEFIFVPIITDANQIMWATKPLGSKSFFFFCSANAALRFAEKWHNFGKEEFWKEVQSLEETSLRDGCGMLGIPMPKLGERLRLASELEKVDWDF